MSVICVSLDEGKIIHDILLYENEKPDFCHPMNSYASPTPVISSGRVYVHFGKYGTACLDCVTGKTIWERRDLDCNHFRGPASSPILFDNKLIVAFDGFDVQYVVALNATNGETIWKTKRSIDYKTDNGDNKKAYCTGTIVKVDNKNLLVMPAAVATEAYDVESGERIWTVYHGGMNASSRPVMDAGGNVIITNGMGRMVSVNPAGQGDITEANVNWMKSSGVPKKSSLVAKGKHLYMVSDKAILTCVDSETGKNVWQERLAGEFAASPIIAGNHILFFSRSGAIYIIKAEPKFQLVATLELGDGFMASPAVAGNQLILRSLTHLYCVAEE